MEKKKYRKRLRKQIEEAYRYPFCRRCREKLDPKWAEKLKEQGSLPLCRKCYPVMMEQFKKLWDLWQKFSQQ